MENKKIIFIHANGFPPNTYENMFNPIREDFNCENYILKPAENDISSILKLKNWNIFSEKFLDTLKSENKIIGIGHSIGGNVILRSAIRKPENFSKIILLDPTLFTRITIFFWRISAFLNIQKIVHPWLKTSLNRKMIYNNFEEIFNLSRYSSIAKSNSCLFKKFLWFIILVSKLYFFALFKPYASGMFEMTHLISPFILFSIHEFIIASKLEPLPDIKTAIFFIIN